jgi:hypothetical protein
VCSHRGIWPALATYIIKKSAFFAAFPKGPGKATRPLVTINQMQTISITQELAALLLFSDRSTQHAKLIHFCEDENDEQALSTKGVHS